MNNRQYGGEIERLRAPERLARMEVARVVELATEGITARSALDVGTGSGIFAEQFASKGMNVAGIDIREDMLDAAREHVPSGDFREGRMEAIPFGEEAFALVFMGHVLHEADDLQQALREAHRVTQLRVVVLEWPYQEQEMGPPLDHRLTEQTVIQAARQAGFANVESFRLEHMVVYRMDKRNLNPWCI
jgi:ubiquinone/menaquinone biosynthesis C-methylase UbiE